MSNQFGFLSDDTFAEKMDTMNQFLAAIATGQGGSLKPTSSPNTGADSNRVKYKNGSPQWQWERTPNAGGSFNVRNVSNTGNLNDSVAYYGSGVAPACNVI